LAELIFFGVFTIILLFAAVRVVTSRNIVHSAFFLILVLFCVAAYFILLFAEFLAAVQILIYAGAVVILVLFALMLTRARVGESTEVANKQVIPAAIVSLVLFGVLGYFFYMEEWSITPALTYRPSLQEISGSLFTNFVLPFEVASVLLLAALVGSIMLAIKEQ
jgi:NADH-quinone oxidoreductase subunit J